MTLSLSLAEMLIMVSFCLLLPHLRHFLAKLELKPFWRKIMTILTIHGKRNEEWEEGRRVIRARTGRKGKKKAHGRIQWSRRKYENTVYNGSKINITHMDVDTTVAVRRRQEPTSSHPDLIDVNTS